MNLHHHHDNLFFNCCLGMSCIPVYTVCSIFFCGFGIFGCLPLFESADFWSLFPLCCLIRPAMLSYFCIWRPVEASRIYLISAVGQGNILFLPYVVGVNFDWNEKDKDGNTLLHYAVQEFEHDDVFISFYSNFQKQQATRYLLAQGVDPSISNNVGKTPYDVMEDRYVSPLDKKLLEKGKIKSRSLALLTQTELMPFTNELKEFLVAECQLDPITAKLYIHYICLDAKLTTFQDFRTFILDKKSKFYSDLQNIYKFDDSTIQTAFRNHDASNNLEPINIFHAFFQKSCGLSGVRSQQLAVNLVLDFQIISVEQLKTALDTNEISSLFEKDELVLIKKAEIVLINQF